MSVIPLFAICLFAITFAAEISQTVVNYDQVALSLLGIVINISILTNTR